MRACSTGSWKLSEGTPSCRNSESARRVQLILAAQRMCRLSRVTTFCAALRTGWGFEVAPGAPTMLVSRDGVIFPDVCFFVTGGTVQRKSDRERAWFRSGFSMWSMSGQ